MRLKNWLYNAYNLWWFHECIVLKWRVSHQSENIKPCVPRILIYSRRYLISWVDLLCLTSLELALFPKGAYCGFRLYSMKLKQVKIKCICYSSGWTFELNEGNVSVLTQRSNIQKMFLFLSIFRIVVVAGPEDQVNSGHDGEQHNHVSGCYPHLKSDRKAPVFSGRAGHNNISNHAYLWSWHCW